jgi:hypothetical protein
VSTHEAYRHTQKLHRSTRSNHAVHTRDTRAAPAGHLLCDDEVHGDVGRGLVYKEHVYPDEQTVCVRMNVFVFVCVRALECKVCATLKMCVVCGVRLHGVSTWTYLAGYCSPIYRGNAESARPPTTLGGVKGSHHLLTTPTPRQ